MAHPIASTYVPTGLPSEGKPEGSNGPPLGLAETISWGADTGESLHEILQESTRHEIHRPTSETDLQELEPI